MLAKRSESIFGNNSCVNENFKNNDDCNCERRIENVTENNSVSDINEICRSCGNRHTILYKLFKSDNSTDIKNKKSTAAETPSLANKISSTDPIANATVKAIVQGQNNMDQIQQELFIWQLGIAKDDGLPQSLCAKCTAQFYMIHKFRRKCLKVQIRLRQHYADQIQKTNKKIKKECLSQAFKVSPTPDHNTSHIKVLQNDFEKSSEKESSDSQEVSIQKHIIFKNSHCNHNNNLIENDWNAQTAKKSASEKFCNYQEFKSQKPKYNDIVQETLLEKVAQLSIYDKDIDTDSDSDIDNYTDTDTNTDNDKDKDNENENESLNNGTGNKNKDCTVDILKDNFDRLQSEENGRRLKGEVSINEDCRSPKASTDLLPNPLNTYLKDKWAEIDKTQCSKKNLPLENNDLTMKNTTNYFTEALMANQTNAQIPEITVVTKAARKEYSHSLTSKRIGCQNETIAKVRKFKSKRERNCQTKEQLIKNPQSDTMSSTVNERLSIVNNAEDIIRPPDITTNSNLIVSATQRCRRTDKHANDSTHSINPCSVRLRRLQFKGQQDIKIACKPKNTQCEKKLKIHVETQKKSTTVVDAINKRTSIYGRCTKDFNGVSKHILPHTLTLPVQKSFWRTKAEMKQNANLHKLNKKIVCHKVPTLKEIVANALHLLHKTTASETQMNNKDNFLGPISTTSASNSNIDIRSELLLNQNKMKSNYLTNTIMRSKALRLLKMSKCFSLKRRKNVIYKQRLTNIISSLQGNCISKTRKKPLSNDKQIAKLTTNLSHYKESLSSQIIVRVPLTSLSEDFRLHTLQQQQQQTFCSGEDNNDIVVDAWDQNKLKHNVDEVDCSEAANFNHLLEVNAAAISKTCNLPQTYTTLSGQNVLHGYEQTISERFNTTLDTFDEGTQTALTTKTSSKINDFLQEFEKHCLQENDSKTKNESESDTDIVKQQEGSTQQTQDTKINEQANQPQQHPEHERIDINKCSELRAQDMHEVETALNGILNEMQDQHIYAPVSSNTEDLFSQSVYSSPIGEQREVSTHYNNNCTSSNSISNNSTPTTNSLMSELADNTNQNNTNMFAPNFSDYKECFSESTQQSEFIGFQNDIPCFENITFNYITNGNAVDHTEFQKLNQLSLQPDIPQCGNAELNHGNIHQNFPKQNIQLTNCSETDAYDACQEATCAARPDETALQLTQLLTDFENSGLSSKNEPDVLVQNISMTNSVDHANSTIQGQSSLLNDTMLASSNAEESTADNMHSNILTPPHTIQWASTCASTGATYIINSSDIYQQQLSSTQPQIQSSPKMFTSDANENYVENSHMTIGQPQSYMIVIPPEYLQNSSPNSPTIVSHHADNSSFAAHSKSILYEAALQAHNTSINKDHHLIDLPVHSPSDDRRPIPTASHRINLVCRFCHKRTRFTNNLAYSNHIIATHPVENPFNCPYCPQYFTRRFKREKHILVSHTLNRFQCGQCGQIFSAQRGLDIHLQRAHAPDQQNQSDQPLQQQQQQIKHHKVHYQKQSHVQPSDDFVHVEDIQLHVTDDFKEKKPTNMHPEDCEERTTNLSNSSRVICCPDCDESETDPDCTTGNAKCIQPSTPFSMPSPVQVEPDSTSTTISLRQFRKRRTSHAQCENTIHKSNASNTITSNSSSNTSTCKVATEDTLANDHHCALRSSHNCLFCDAQFTNEIALRKHHHLAHGNQTPMPFTCSICKRGYRMRSALQRHMESHEEEGRPYECVLCHVRFPRPSQLTLHKLAVHSTKKPFTCNECGKQFGTEGVLRTHMKFHGERKFKCDQCDRAFFQHKDLVRHRRIHTGELFYKCEFCDSSFLHYTRLIAHINVHVPLGTTLDENAEVPIRSQPHSATEEDTYLQQPDSMPITPLDSTNNYSH